METNSRSNSRRRAAAILLGYNLPWILWTFAAIATVVGQGVPWPCLTSRWLGWCPGCGLTRDYAAFLRGDGLPGEWCLLILAGFAANAVFSIWKALHTAFNPSPPTVESITSAAHRAGAV